MDFKEPPLVTERVRVTAQNMGQLYRCLNKVQRISVSAMNPVPSESGTIGTFNLSLEGPAEYFSRLRRLLATDAVNWLS